MNRVDRRFAPRFRALAPKARRSRLAIQSLEDRTVPAVYHVTDLSDSGAGTLRDAITQANASAGTDEVIFDVAGTVTLASALPTITDSVRIYGLGPTQTVVSANGGAFSVFGGSGAINMALIGMEITGATGGAGGGITSGTGDLYVKNCLIDNNTGYEGGGIYIPPGQSGLTSVIDSTISGNTGGTGGIYFYSSGGLLVTGSTIDDNTGTSTIDYNGGGIIFYGGINSFGFTIQDSTITGNSSNSQAGGGGINFDSASGTVTISNSTITNNTAANSSATGGGGIGLTYSSLTVTITSTIIAGNSGPAEADLGLSSSSSGSTVNGDYNLLGVLPASGYNSGGHDLSGSSGSPLDPQLGGLADNGGPTKTQLPNSGSPVIDAGANPNGLAQDQRHVARSDGQTDIGAVEVQVNGLPTADATATDVTDLQAGQTAYTFTVTYTDPAGGTQGIDYTNSVLNNDSAVIVTGPNSFSAAATFVSSSPASNGTPLTVTYSIVPPSGQWRSSGNGDYTVVMQGSQVKDLDGNYVQGGPIGTFNVSLLPSDPIASGSAADVTTPGATSYTFTVTYSDPNGTNNGLQHISFVGNNNAVVVNGPGGSLPATYVSADFTTDGTPRTVTYSITPPGGSWDATDDGTYTVDVQANQVFDLDNNPVPAGTVATFTVNIPEILTVTNADDSGTGSLRDALTQAETTTGSDLILFDPTFFSTPRTITLGSPLPAFTSAGGDLTIQGPGADKLTIDGQGKYQVFNSNSVNLTMSGITVTGGYAVNGGAIYAAGSGNVTFDHMVFTGNKAATGSYSFTAGDGGAIDLGEFATIILTVKDSTITGNTATNNGGGINLQYGNATLHLYDSTVSNNSQTYAAAGSYSQYAPYIGGGGIQMGGIPFAGPVIIRNSTIANNTSASSGGGIWGNAFGGTLLVQNSTISGNSAALGGTGSLGYTTGGGGIGFFYFVPTVTLENSVVSGNTNPPGSPDIQTIDTVNAYYSLIGDTSGIGTFNADTVSTGLVGKDPLLGPLQDNGGPTFTMAPQVGSPLIDAGPTTDYAGDTTDQRGLGRFYTTGGHEDIGSIEAQPAIPTVTLDPAQKAFTNDETQAVFDVTFDQPVTGFDPSQVLLSGTAGGTPTADVTAIDPLHYTVTVTGMSGDGTLTVDIAAGTGTFGLNGSGMNNVASTAGATVTFDTTPPTETITLDASQTPYTNHGPIVFDVTFSEPVMGFTPADVQLSGTETGTTVQSVTSIGGSQTDYAVTITGMAAGTQGTVVINVPAAAVGLTDLAGNANVTSTNTGNTVTFDQVPPTVTVSPTAGQGNPGGGASVSLVVSFSEPIQSLTTADLDFTGPAGTTASISGPAAGTNDYTVTFTGMTTSGTITLAIDPGAVQDLVGNGNVGSNTQSITYVHSGSLVFHDPSYTANAQGGVTLTVTVDRVGGQDGPLTVSYATADGTGANAAKAGTDYTAKSGSLNWADQETTSKTISIPILNFDELANGFKADPTFTVGLSSVSLSGALGVPAASTLTAPITLVEQAGIQFKQATTRIDESAGTATITVSRLGDTSGTVTANYATSAGTATAGADYTDVSGTLTWNPGDTDLTFTVPITDDALNEGKETINLALSNLVGNAVLAPQSTATLVINPSDGVTIHGTDKKPSSTFVDADGDLVTITLGGKAGTLTYYLTNGVNGAQPKSNGPLAEIDLSGTDPTKTTVGIKVKKPKGGTGDGRVQLGEVDGTGFKSFSAKGADVIGAGFNLTGFAGSITVGNVSNGADFELAGPIPTTKSVTKIAAGVIGDGTDINVAAPLGGLTAVAVGKGTIEAPSIGSIKVTGQKANAKKGIAGNPGDFDSTLTISGAGVDPIKGKALGSLSVAGTVDHAVLTVHGNVGAVTVGAFNTSDLFVGYTGPVDGSGSFDSNPYGLTSFTTKAATHSFVDSYVIATAIKSVTLADVDTTNGGTKFGFDFRNVSRGGKPFGGVGKLAVTDKTNKLSYNTKSGGTQILKDDFEVKKL